MAAERAWSRLALAGAVVAFLLLASAQLSRPLMYDDVNFAFAARAVEETGLPFGNQGWMGDRGDFSQREQWALWHPPLYVYALGAVARVLGPSPAALRVLGLAGGVATGLLTYWLALMVTARDLPGRRAAAALAASLALLSPLAVQSALILDIDATLLLPLTLLFLLLYLAWEDTPRRWLWLGPLFALLLWAKMTNPLPLLVAVAAWQTLRGRWRRALLQVGGIGLSGAALFLASWWAVAALLRLPFDMPFGVNLAQWQESSKVARDAYSTPGTFVEGLQPTVIWAGPWLVALGLAAAAVRAGGLAERWCLRRVDLLLGLLVILVVGYVNKSAGWLPKYQVALLPLLAAAGAPLLARERWDARGPLIGLAALVAAGAVVASRGVRDEWALRRSWVLPDGGAWWLLALLLAGALALALVPGRGRARLAWGTALPLAMAALAVGWSLGTGAILARLPYSTTYYYGTRGLEPAVAWVNDHLGPTDLYVASKEVAWAARAQRYVDEETLVKFLEEGRPFGTTWEGEPIRAVVAWTHEPYINDLLFARLPALGYRETVRFDDYVVLEPIAPPAQ